MGLFKTQGVYSVSLIWQPSNVKPLCNKQQWICLLSSSKLPTFPFHWTWRGHLNKQSSEADEVFDSFDADVGTPSSAAPPFLGVHPRFLVRPRSSEVPAPNTGFSVASACHTVHVGRGEVDVALSWPLWFLFLRLESLQFLPLVPSLGSLKSWEALSRTDDCFLWETYCSSFCTVASTKSLVSTYRTVFFLFPRPPACLPPSFISEALLYFTSLLRDKRLA